MRATNPQPKNKYIVEQATSHVVSDVRERCGLVPRADPLRPGVTQGHNQDRSRRPPLNALERYDAALTQDDKMLLDNNMKACQ